MEQSNFQGRNCRGQTDKVRSPRGDEVGREQGAQEGPCDPTGSRTGAGEPEEACCRPADDQEAERHRPNEEGARLELSPFPALAALKQA